MIVPHECAPSHRCAALQRARRARAGYRSEARSHKKARSRALAGIRSNRPRAGEPAPDRAPAQADKPADVRAASRNAQMGQDDILDAAARLVAVAELGEEPNVVAGR